MRRQIGRCMSWVSIFLLGNYMMIKILTALEPLNAEMVFVLIVMNAIVIGLIMEFD